jgi:transposase
MNWVKQDDLDSGRRTDGLTRAENAEMTKLRRRVRDLEMERDILKKAAAWFARESNSIPNKSSDS